MPKKRGNFLIRSKEARTFNFQLKNGEKLNYDFSHVDPLSLRRRNFLESVLSVFERSFPFYELKLLKSSYIRTPM